jgi:hypothetical protein
MWMVVLLVLVVVDLLAGIASAILLSLPTATVTIMAQSTAVTVTKTLRLRTEGEQQGEQLLVGRSLSTLTLSQARTVPTSGTGHQDAAAAHGMVTFYNALSLVQTVPAGEMLTGTDGIQVVTDQDAVIPAAILPTFGQATVTAHSLQIGPIGNIGAYDLSGPMLPRLCARQEHERLHGRTDCTILSYGDRARPRRSKRVSPKAYRQPYKLS